MGQKLNRGAAEVTRWMMSGIVVYGVLQIDLSNGLFYYLGQSFGAIAFMALVVVISAYLIQPLDPDIEVDPFWE